MQVFSFLPYEDYILKTVVNSSYSKSALTLLVTCLVTLVLKVHLTSVLSALVTLGNVFDFFVPVVISVLVSSVSDTLFRYADTHKPAYERLVTYLLENYSQENFVTWKRIALLVLFSYLMLILLIVPLDNVTIMIATLQTALSFVITDCLENRTVQKLWKKLQQRKKKPVKKIRDRVNSKPPTPPRSVEELPCSAPSTPPRVSLSQL